MKKSDKNNDRNEKFIEELLSAVAQEASRRTVIEYTKKQKAAQKQAHDYRLHNTRELLKKYRGLKKADRKNREKLEQIDENADFSDLSWRNVTDKTHSSFVSNSRITHFSMERADWAIKWFKEDCFRSGNPKDEVMYKVIYDIFLDMTVPVGKKIDYQVIADKYDISKSTVFRYVDQAIKRIENYLWGFNLIDDVKKE